MRDPDLRVDRPVIGIGNDYPAAFELAPHSHARGQLLHAARGVVAVSTPHGAWIAPPARAVWVPAGMPHSVRMIGEVSTRSVMITPVEAASIGATCKVLAVSPLLALLLDEAAGMAVEYDEAGRDGLVMQLVIAEAARAPTIPLAVPFPGHAALASRCHAFFEQPDAGSRIDDWAEALGCNRRSFTRLFRHETGMSFAEWRQRACLAVALPLLGAGRSVTDVALDLGYASTASFSTMFKRVLGMSPSQYR